MTTTFPAAFNLADYYLFDRLREGKGDNIAVRFGETTWTYDDVASRARGFASLLLSVGVRRGERVLIILPDVPPFAWTLFGTLAAGAVVTMGNPDVPAGALEYLVEYTRATVIVTVPKVYVALREAMKQQRIGADVRAMWAVPDAPTGSECESLRGELEDAGADLSVAISQAPARDAWPQTHRDEPAIWLFTSGSTGEPKANIHAHRDFAFNTEVYAKGTVGYAEGDVTVSVPRLYFGYATGTTLLFPFAVGASVGLFSERPTPEALTRAIIAYRPTIVTNVPTMLGKLLDHDEMLTSRGEFGLDFSSIRFSLSAGEALPEALLNRWNARFASDVYDGIGSRCSTSTRATDPATCARDRSARQSRAMSCACSPKRPTAPERPSASPGKLGCSGSGATARRWATGSIATRASRRSSATGAAPAICSRRTLPDTCILQADQTSC